MVLNQLNSSSKSSSALLSLQGTKMDRNNDDRNHLVRPTEAQLRWAQFHHKKRAQAVRENVERMWQMPPRVEDVKGAFPGDGASSDEGSTKTRKAGRIRKKNKPRISRGRRAMLRVSKRAYAQRRATILKEGFQCYGDKENDEDESSAVDDLLDEETTGEFKKKRRKRQTRRVQSTEDEERVKRFEAAFSMLLSMKPQQQPVITAPSRRWTRPKGMSSALNVDGTNYADWKWGLARRKRAAGQKSGRSASELPFDRRASWLVHLPARQSTSRRLPFSQAVASDGTPLKPVNVYGGREVFMSPGQMKFDELVSRLQYMDATHQTFPLPENDSEGFDASARYLDQLPKSKQGLGSPQRVSRDAFQNQEGIVDPYFRGGDNMMQGHPHTLYSPSSMEAESDFSIEERDMDLGESPVRRPTSEGEASSPQSDYFAQFREGPEEKTHDPSLSRDEAYSRRGTGNLEQPDLNAIPEAGVPLRPVSDYASKDTREPPKRGQPALNPTNNQDPSVEMASPKSTSSFRLKGAVGGLFNLVAGTSNSDDVKAVAAFRKTQGQKTNDDSTSTSSFRLLPDGIRRVVQGFSSKNVEADKPPEGGDQDEDDFPQPGLEPMHPASDSTYLSSPSRSFGSRSGVESSVSPEHGRLIHDNVMQHSALFGDQAVIDTDDTTSDASGSKMDPKTAASLMLSPTILTKRHQQAIRAVEKRKWEQVTYLISANPWLAEMMEVTTLQYLLHKVALCGASKVLWDTDTGAILDVDGVAPQELNQELIRLFPASLHKFDQEGNLPLHMAAASGNVEMVKLLGERFSSGASVRNNDGMLPLHLAIQACSHPIANAAGEVIPGSEYISEVLKLFPGAVAVTDNDGSLPLHIAAAVLEGNIGVDVIYTLLDEADRLAKSEGGLRLTVKVKSRTGDEDDNASVCTLETASPTIVDDDEMYCNLARNEMGRTPLVKAIEAGSGWEVIEALVCGPGGNRASLLPDENMCNPLHLLVSEEFGDPVGALAVLKVAPEAASSRNFEGMLPIEIACREGMPREVLVALVLVDLPVDLNEKEGVSVRRGHGGSWWFLTCECDDDYVDIVEEVISICSYQHLRELCFMKGGQRFNGATLVSRATPRCQDILRRALRFVGRFEFLGGSALYSDDTVGLKVFDALDFGTSDEPYEEGIRVLLMCYDDEDGFERETATVRDEELDFAYVEEFFEFAVHEPAGGNKNTNLPQQFCLAIDRPALTLERVVDSMRRNEEYDYNDEMRSRYHSKVCMVLRQIAKSIRYIHRRGIVHGDIGLGSCGKFDDNWKLTNMVGSQRVGRLFSPSRLEEASPPESVELLREMAEGSRESARGRATLVSEMEADLSIDVWGFGKLAFESFTGETLIEFDPEKGLRKDNRTLVKLLKWNESNLRGVINRLRDAGLPMVGADLVSHCLLPNPDDRPTMEEVLDHPFWKDMRRRMASSARSISSKYSRDSMQEI